MDPSRDCGGKIADCCEGLRGGGGGRRKLTPGKTELVNKSIDYTAYPLKEANYPTISPNTCFCYTDRIYLDRTHLL